MQSWFLFRLSIFWKDGNMLTDKFGTTRKRIVQWLIKMKFLKIYAIVFLKSFIKVNKMGKIPKKLIENPNETQGICVVWKGMRTALLATQFTHPVNLWWGILNLEPKRTSRAIYRAKKAIFVQHLALPLEKVWPHTMWVSKYNLPTYSHCVTNYMHKNACSYWLAQ